MRTKRSHAQAPGEIILIRHGETEWSRDGRHTGPGSDIPLTEEGRAQAASLRARLAALNAASVLTSPAQRARETCALAGLADRAEVEPALSEWDYGDFEGLRMAEIQERSPGWSLWRDGAPGGEGPQAIGARADALLERLRARSGTLVLFSHGHFLRVLGARWIGLPTAGGARFALAPAAISILGFERQTEVISSWNLA
jgi:broad specificity phosphatase PhoE